MGLERHFCVHGEGWQGVQHGQTCSKVGVMRGVGFRRGAARHWTVLCSCFAGWGPSCKAFFLYAPFCDSSTRPVDLGFWATVAYQKTREEQVATKVMVLAQAMWMALW